MSASRVYVCTERGCGKRSAHRELAAALDGVVVVAPVACQSVCDGPVAGLVVDGRLQWFEEVTSTKSRLGLVRLALHGGALPKALAKRRRPKRAGKLRG